jgi:hypothetical protein
MFVAKEIIASRRLPAILAGSFWGGAGIAKIFDPSVVQIPVLSTQFPASWGVGIGFLELAVAVLYISGRYGVALLALCSSVLVVHGLSLILYPDTPCGCFGRSISMSQSLGLLVGMLALVLHSFLLLERLDLSNGGKTRA